MSPLVLWNFKQRQTGPLLRYSYSWSHVRFTKIQLSDVHLNRLCSHGFIATGLSQWHMETHVNVYVCVCVCVKHITHDQSGKKKRFRMLTENVPTSENQNGYPLSVCVYVCSCLNSPVLHHRFNLYFLSHLMCLMCQGCWHSEYSVCHNGRHRLPGDTQLYWGTSRAIMGCQERETRLYNERKRVRVFSMWAHIHTLIYGSRNMRMSLIQYVQQVNSQHDADTHVCT